MTRLAPLVALMALSVTARVRAQEMAGRDIEYPTPTEGTTGASCDANDECGPTERCLAHRCATAASCESNGDCAVPGERCLAGQCAWVGHCQSNSDCAEPSERCVANQCVGVQSRSCGERSYVPPRHLYENIPIGGETAHDPHVGHAFRGLGSPGHQFEIEHSFRGTSFGRAIGGTTFDHFVAVDAALANLSGAMGRFCLTAGVDFDAVAGWYDPNAGPTGSAASIQASGPRIGVRLGLLSRTMQDDTRIRLEIGGVLPAMDGSSSASDPLRIQTGVFGGLAHGVDDEIMTLTPLDWGVRAIGTLDSQFSSPGDHAGGVWLRARVSLGYGRLQTFTGPREGLLGGVSVSLLAGSHFYDGWSLRLGGRAALGVGALWPTDVILPMEALGVIELGHARNAAVGRTSMPAAGGSVIGLEAGVVFARLGVLMLGEESYFKFGVRYIGAFDGW